MPEVWVVIEVNVNHIYERHARDCRVIGVFSEKALAQQFVKDNPTPERSPLHYAVELHVVDAHVGEKGLWQKKTRWEVRLLNGNAPTFKKKKKADDQ